MRRLTISILFVFSFYFSIAQTEPCLKCYENPLRAERVESCCPFKDTLTDDLKKKLLYREQNFDFHYTLRKIQEPSTVTSFLTRTINISGYQKKNFILDSDLQLPISIGGKRFGLNELQVIPRFKVRIFQDDAKVPYGPKGDASLPVRTPSNIIGIAYYRTFRNHWNDNTPQNFKEKLLKNKYLGLYAFHHSNGQDGNEIDSTAKSKGEVNVYNGNFGENLVFEFIVGGRIKGITDGDAIRLPSNRKKIQNNKSGKQIYLKIANRKEYYWKMSYEWHPKGLSNSVFDSFSMYGRHRINLNFTMLSIPTLWELLGDGTRWCSVVPEKSYERWRFTANINYIADNAYKRGNTQELKPIEQFNMKYRLNMWVTAYRTFGQSKYTAFFAQAGYHGSDNYNIYFNQSLWHFKAGLAFAFFDKPEEPDQIK